MTDWASYVICTAPRSGSTLLCKLLAATEPHYDGETIKARAATMKAYDDGWNAWFGHQGIEPVRLTYDALPGDPIGTLRHFLDCLGLDRAAADGVTPGIGRMADATSRDWIVRFRREAGLA